MKDKKPYFCIQISNLVINNLVINNLVISNLVINLVNSNLKLPVFMISTDKNSF